MKYPFANCYLVLKSAAVAAESSVVRLRWFCFMFEESNLFKRKEKRQCRQLEANFAENDVYEGAEIKEERQKIYSFFFVCFPKFREMMTKVFAFLYRFLRIYIFVLCRLCIFVYTVCEL